MILLLITTACDEISSQSPTSTPPSEPWPQTEACEGLDDWPNAWANLEWDVLDRIDAVRQEGADCEDRGKWGPAPSLTRRSALDCAARFHAQDMVDREYFGRIDPDGIDARGRVDAAGYSAAIVVQHVAAGPRDAHELIEMTWLPRPVPCQSLLSSEVTEIGLGLVGEFDEERTTTWVMVLATPGEPSEDEDEPPEG